MFAVNRFSYSKLGCILVSLSVVRLDVCELFSKQTFKRIILTTVSLNVRHKENIAWKIELKNHFTIHCSASILQCIQLFCQWRKLELFEKLLVMTITRIIGVYIIVFECTGQHAKKNNNTNNKSRPKQKKTVNYEENIKARTANIRVHVFQQFFFEFSLFLFVALLSPLFVAGFVLFGLRLKECLTISKQRNWRLQKARRQFNKWENFYGKKFNQQLLKFERITVHYHYVIKHRNTTTI